MSAATAIGVLRVLSNAVGTSLLYAQDHPRVALLLPQLLAEVHRFVGEGGEQTLVFMKDLVLYQGKPLPNDPHLERLVRICQRQRLGFIQFRRGVERADVQHLLALLIGLESYDGFRTGSATIHCGSVDVVENDATGVERDIPGFAALTDAELQGLTGFYETVSQQGTINTREMAIIVAGFISAFRREANPLLALVPLRLADEYTFTHSLNVCILNIAQGMNLGIAGPLLHDLGIAGLLHDVGKIFVAREITAKPGRLSDAEWLLMRSHPVRGAQYLLGQNGVPRLAVVSAFEHHLRFDLRGYPSVPAGWRLSLASQMTMISDTFDALRTRRIYKEPWDFPRICGHMLNLAGSQLHPELTLHFLKTVAALGERQLRQETGVI